MILMSNAMMGAAGYQAAGDGLITDGLVSRWAFSEGVGTTVADEISGHNGTLSSAVIWDNGNAPTALVQNAARFSLSGHRMSVPTTADLSPGTGDFSLAIWFFVDSFSGQAFLLRKYGDTGQKYLGVYIGSDGELMTVIRDGNGNQSFISTPSAPYRDSQWHSLIQTRTGGNQILTLDGIDVVTVDASAVGDVDISLGAPWTFGRWEGYLGDQFGAPFSGRLADIRYYNRALTAQERIRYADGEG